MTMRMLKVFLLVFTLLLFSNVFAQNKDDEVLMTIAGDPVTRTEFIDVYLKNNISNNVIDKKSLEELPPEQVGRDPFQNEGPCLLQSRPTDYSDL